MKIAFNKAVIAILGIHLFCAKSIYYVLKQKIQTYRIDPNYAPNGAASSVNVSLLTRPHGWLYSKQHRSFLGIDQPVHFTKEKEVYDDAR